MNSITSSDHLQIGRWRAQRDTGEIAGPDGVERLEPKVMDLS
jgi:hypothetical protein